MQGTTTILNSALKYGTSVKRIVLTSSLASIREADPNPRTYDETNWNNAAVAAVKSKGAGAGPVLIYLASKTLAERAAWEFVDAHKAELTWDLVALNPPFIFGVRSTEYSSLYAPTDDTQPSLSPAPTINDINTSQREVYDTLAGARTGEQLRGQGNWVHVRVAAEAHVRATHAPAAGGERIIVRNGYFFYQDFRKSVFLFPDSIIIITERSVVTKSMQRQSSGSRMWHVANRTRRRTSRKLLT